MSGLFLGVRWGSALRSLIEIIRDKENTEAVFLFVDSISGSAVDEVTKRFAADPVGKVILEEKRSLLDTLCNRERLEACAPGTLGRAYADFVYGEGLSAEGLVMASQTSTLYKSKEDEQRLFVGDRTRDAHDIWHIVTGYGREGLGELCILTFSYAQLGHRGVGLLARIGLYIGLWRTRKSKGLNLRALTDEAMRRGKECAWLPPVDWESMMDMQLDEVRKVLRIPEATVYLEHAPIVERIAAKEARQRAEKAAAEAAAAGTNQQPPLAA